MNTYLSIVLAVVQGIALYGCASNPRVRTSCVNSGDTQGTISVIALDPWGYRFRFLDSVAEPGYGRPGVWIRNVATGLRLQGVTDAEGHASFRVTPGRHVVVVGGDGSTQYPWGPTEKTITVAAGCAVSITIRVRLALMGDDI
jgi:hypothetical protein